MAFVRTVPAGEATGLARQQYDADVKDLGYVRNLTAGLSLRPEAAEAWMNLARVIRSGMDLRRYELVTLAAARAQRSSYCCLAHGQVLRDKFFSPEQVAALARDPRAAGLGPADVAMMGFAEKVTRDAQAVTAGDVDELRRHGFSDRDIVDIALAAAARNFFSRLLDALGVTPDAAYRTLPQVMREALTVGRPIDGQEQEQ
jgi:uncharacterized peroxidase-related enzyme